MLEEALKQNTVAIKALTAAIAHKGGAAKPAGTKAASAEDQAAAKPEGKKAPAVSVKAVSDLVLSLVELEQRPAVVKLLKQHGATKVKDVAKSKLAALHKRLAAVLVKAKAAKAAEESGDEEEVDFDEILENGELDDDPIDDDDLDFLG